MSRNAYPAQVDVAIVGSGPTGSAYARIVTELAPHATIAMFEVGPTVSDPAGAHVKNIEDPQERSAAQRASEGPGAHMETVNSPGAVKSGQRRARPGTFLLEDGFQQPGEDGLPVVAMSSNVGGMAAHWTAACPRPGGSERISFLENLDELLGEAERLLGVTADAFDETPFGDIVLAHLTAAAGDRDGAARVQRMPLAVHRRDDGRLMWSGSDVVLGDVTRANDRFTLHDRSLVTEVLRTDGRATGIRVKDLRTDEETTVHARFVVVAADALRTPQLLWTSGIRPHALGRYLNDQTQIVFATRLREAAGMAVSARAGAGLSEYSGVNWVPFTDDMPFHGQVMQLDASPVPLAEDDPVVPGSVVGIGFFCAKDLQEDDCVTFSESKTDGYGMPAPQIHYRLTETDHAVFERAEREIFALAEAVGEPLDDRPFRMPLGSSLHYQGTTRMGATHDDTSVCGPDSEVWETPGLFVAGNGVIPTPTACNPTLTSVALAVAGARSIADRLHS